MGSSYSVQEPPLENVPSACTLTEVPLHQVILLGYDSHHMKNTDYVYIIYYISSSCSGTEQI